MQDTSNSDKKIRVGILFGGKSAEHEVSLQSARSILNAIDKDKFETVLIGIDKSGKWHFDTNNNLLDNSSLPTLGSIAEASTLVPGDNNGSIVKALSTETQQTLDVIFPVLHGPMGEDGTIQGFLELANVPYVGPGVLGSAIGMDKDVMKRLLRDSGILVTEFEVLTPTDLDSLNEENIVGKYGLPLFVKPANMGSSVGVHKVNSTEDIRTAIEDAFNYDLKVLVEKAIVGDEIECAVLGNDSPEASIIGRIIPRENDYYSYEAKYIDEDGALLEIPAQIDPGLAAKAQEVALQAFKALACQGMSRVDMFATEDGSIVVNEINTIPGFTKISMYPKLWEASGVSYTELITRLINLAIERFNQRQKLQSNYSGHM